MIDLSEYELDMYPHEAKVFYAERHQHLWIEFVEQAVERAGFSGLTDTTGISKAEFAEKIRRLD